MSADTVTDIRRILYRGFSIAVIADEVGDSQWDVVGVLEGGGMISVNRRTKTFVSQELADMRA